MKAILFYLFCMLFAWNSLSQSVTKVPDTSKILFPYTKAQSLICNYEGLPIKKTRTISFETDEASYIDVDISPDGRTLLFSFLGNLYVMPVSGGTARQITRGLAINKCPVWSPDGRLIAYESDASGSIQLHVDDTSGTFHKILNSDIIDNGNFEPSWFPDSKKVILRHDIRDLSGFTSQIPTEIDQVLGFSPDRDSIYYLSQQSNGSSAVYISHMLTGEGRQLIDLGLPLNTFHHAMLTPDRTWLTYIKSNSAWSLDTLIAFNLVSGNAKAITALNTPFSGMSVSHYSFAPDSKKIYIGYGGKIHCIDIISGENDIIPFHAKVSVDLGDRIYNTSKLRLDSFNVRYIRTARRSPNGKQLIFSSLNRLYVMTLPNGIPRVLVNQAGNQHQPSYSPDGRWIVYVTWEDSVGGHVWRVGSKGGKPERLTQQPALYFNPSYSPDGSLIVVVVGNNQLGLRDDPGLGAIKIISLNDRSITKIADTVPLFNNPYFIGNNHHVIFKPNQIGWDKDLWPQLVSQNISTGTRHVLVNARKNSKSMAPIRQIIYSPDGRYVVFMYNGDLYLVPVSSGLTPQTIFDENVKIKPIRFATGCVDPQWEDGGKVLSWINVNEYCRINPDKILLPTIYRNGIVQNLGENNINDIHLQEDERTIINLKSPRLCSKEGIALTNARIITMTRDSVLERGIILIKEGRIMHVGKVGSVLIPRNFKIMNVAGKTIMPGLIDTHSHMYEAVPPDVFLQQSWQDILNLAFGITTVRDPSGSYDTFGYSELLESGSMVGPRLFTVGNSVRPHYNLSSLNEGKIIVENRFKMGATYIKQYKQPTRLQRQLLLMACGEAGINMTNEAERHPLYCVGMIKDGSTGIEHNPEWGDVYKDIITLVSKSGTSLTPTLQVSSVGEAKNYFRKTFASLFEEYISFLPTQAKNSILHEVENSSLDSSFVYLSKIDAAFKKAGGKIVLGSHGEDQGLGVHFELWGLAMGGLTNFEALQTATIDAAETLGLQEDLGTIEAGKIADLIVLDENPLHDIHNSSSVRYVVRAGVLFESAKLKSGIKKHN